jgi:hypothetical protein
LEHKIASHKELVREDSLFLLQELSERLQLELKSSVNFSPLLQGHPLFVRAISLAKVVVHQLASTALQIRHGATDDIIFAKGSMSPEMVFVKKGNFHYSRNDESQWEEVLPGDWCCEPCLWVPWPCRGTLTAAECDVRLIVLDFKEFQFVTQANEVVCTLLSAYAAIYVDCLNEVLTSDLTDLSKHEQGSDHVNNCLYELESWLDRLQDRKNYKKSTGSKRKGSQGSNEAPRAIGN